MNKLTIFPRCKGWDEIESDLKGAGISCEHTFRTLCHEPAQIQELVVLVGSIQAIALALVGIAKHRKKKLLVKDGTRQFYAENYSVEELADIMKVAREVEIQDDDDKSAA
jgi:hypothetical protein